jgi:hypothetical protein
MHEMAGYRYDNEGRNLALKLDGPAVPLPPQLADVPIPAPPRQEGSPAQIAEGEVLYNRFCSRCHIDDRGVLPDIRRTTPEKHHIFYDIVMNEMSTARSWFARSQLRSTTRCLAAGDC